VGFLTALGCGFVTMMFQSLYAVLCSFSVELPVRDFRAFVPNCSLTLSLSKKSTEEPELTLVGKSRVWMPSQDSRKPNDGVCCCLSVEMTWYTHQSQLRSLPIRIAHHGIEMAVTSVPSTVIGFRHSLLPDMRFDNEIRYV
jgi:hypothetical protein